MLVAGCMINAALMVRFGYYMPWYFSGGALVVVSSALMCMLLLSLGKVIFLK